MKIKNQFQMDASTATIFLKLVGQFERTVGHNQTVPTFFG